MPTSEGWEVFTECDYMPVSPADSLLWLQQLLIWPLWWTITSISLLLMALLQGCNTHSHLSVVSQCVLLLLKFTSSSLIFSFSFCVLRLFAQVTFRPLWRHLAASPHVNTNMRLAALRKQFQSQSLIITLRGNFTFNIRVSSSNCLARTHRLHLKVFKEFLPTFSHIYKTHNWANKLSATIKNDNCLFIYLLGGVDIKYMSFGACHRLHKWNSRGINKHVLKTLECGWNRSLGSSGKEKKKHHQQRKRSVAKTPGVKQQAVGHKKHTSVKHLKWSLLFIHYYSQFWHWPPENSQNLTRFCVQVGTGQGS